MSCYDLRVLLGVPGGSYRILTTLKGMWRILKGGELLSGPWMSFEVLEGREVSGGIPKEFLEALIGVKILKVSWSMN